MAFGTIQTTDMQSPLGLWVSAHARVTSHLLQATCPCPQPWLTQNVDLHGAGAVEFVHALDFREGDKVTALESMPDLIQAGDDTRAVLVGREVSLRERLRTAGEDRNDCCCPLP